MNVSTLDEVFREVYHPSKMIAPTSEIVDYWMDRGFAAPKFRYLAPSYVAALGLRHTKIRMPALPQSVSAMDLLREASSRPFAWGLSSARTVLFEGWYYAQEFEGSYRAVVPATEDA